MSVESLFVMLMVGLVTGWVAATFVKDGALGLVGNMVVGVAGAVIGGLLLPSPVETRIGPGLVAAILSAATGAVVLLVLLRYLRRA